MFPAFHVHIRLLCPVSPASVNVLVPNCKIYNDASCDISADGQLLAVFIPGSQRGFPDEGILAIYSLAPHNLGEMLYTKRFGAVEFRIQQFPCRCPDLDVSPGRL